MQFASNSLSTEKPISTVADPDHELRFFVTCPASFSSFCDSFFFTQNKGGAEPPRPLDLPLLNQALKKPHLWISKMKKEKKKKKRKEK